MSSSPVEKKMNIKVPRNSAAIAYAKRSKVEQGKDQKTSFSNIVRASAFTEQDHARYAG